MISCFAQVLLPELLFVSDLFRQVLVSFLISESYLVGDPCFYSCQVPFHLVLLIIALKPHFF